LQLYIGSIKIGPDLICHDSFEKAAVELIQGNSAVVVSSWRLLVKNGGRNHHKYFRTKAD
jgi:hypothetical protein